MFQLSALASSFFSHPILPLHLTFFSFFIDSLTTYSKYFYGKLRYQVMCRLVVLCAWSSFFPFHVLVGNFASVCIPFTLYRAYNVFTLNMVYPTLWMIVYREVLISTECCTLGNVTFRLKQNTQQYQVYTVRYKKDKSVSFFSNWFTSSFHILYIVSCMKRKKEGNENLRSFTFQSHWILPKLKLVQKTEVLPSSCDVNHEIAISSTLIGREL